MVKGHRIESLVDIEEFLLKISSFSREQIECTSHTFFRLSDNQRKIFKCDKIKDFLLLEKPVLVGKQFNGCYAIFFPYKRKNYIRVIADITHNKVEIVTFYTIDQNQFPKIK
jgi:hypothetical protein